MRIGSVSNLPRTHLSALIAAGLLLAACSGTLIHKPGQLSLQDSNIRIFDEVEEILADNIFDPEILSEEWASTSAPARTAAAGAQSTSCLYYGVIEPRLMSLGLSHLSLTLPPGVTVNYSDPLLSQTGIRISASGVNICEPAGFDCVMSEERGETEGRLVVSAVEPMSEAAVAGVVPTSIVKSMSLGPYVDGLSTINVGLERGVRDYTVTYTVRRDAEPPRRSRMLEGNSLLIRFDEFSATSVRWAIEQINAHQPNALILDFRHNAGGAVSARNELLGKILEPGVSLGFIVNRGVRTEEFAQAGREEIFRGPIVVLLGPFTNSAAESTAAVLQDHQRAHLVGLRTSGNVLRSRPFTLHDGGRLHVPIADYLTPRGRRIEGDGVVPDTEVALACDNDCSVDRELAVALEYIKAQ